MNLQEKLKQRVATIDAEYDPLEESSNVVNLPVFDQGTIDVVPDFAITLAEAKQRFQRLQSFVQEMISGQDYNLVPGYPKPTLLKPGAEKLAEIFGLSKQVEVINRTEDWKTGIFAYEVKVSLINKRTGYLEADGVGACNTRENKYSTQNAYTISNSILKMAKKRAFIDAVLSATGSSGCFTQDLEHLEQVNQSAPIIKPSSQPRTMPKPSFPASPASRPSFPQGTAQGKADTKRVPIGTITQPQVTKIQTLCTGLGISTQDLQEILSDNFAVAQVQQLGKSQASALITHLIDIQG